MLCTLEIIGFMSNNNILVLFWQIFTASKGRPVLSLLFSSNNLYHLQPVAQLHSFFERDGGREVSALDSRSEGPWFKPRWGLKFQGFRIHSFHSTLGRLGDCDKCPSCKTGVPCNENHPVHVKDFTELLC